MLCRAHFVAWGMHVRPSDMVSCLPRAASRVLTQMAGLLHAYETGTMRLGLVQEHASLLQAVRQDTATALTALSGLIFASIKRAPWQPHGIRPLLVGRVGMMPSMPSCLVYGIQLAWADFKSNFFRARRQYPRACWTHAQLSN